MAVATAHVLHGIDAAGTFLSQVSNARVSPGIEPLLATPAGFPQPLFVGNARQSAVVSFDSAQVKTVLDTTGITIADLSSGNTDLYFKKVKDLASREADASLVHTRLRMANAGLECASLTARHDSRAVASCRIFNPWDGTNEPIVPAGTIALSGTPVAAEHFVAGPVWVNTTQLNGIQEISIDFGRSFIEAGSGGELYPSLIAEQAIAPVVTIRCLDLPWTTFGLNGLAITALSVYLRKKDTTGNVADGTTTHIKFSATAGLCLIDDTSAGGNEQGVTTVQCLLVAPNAAGNSIVVNTAIAITS